jgi:hypothetical protein
LKITVRVRLLVKLLTVHICPCTELQFDHPPNVEAPVGVAVSTIVDPGGRAVLQVDAQPRPGGTLVTVPVPEP